MDASLKQTIWKQFGAAIDMLENAIAECSEHLWNTDSEFWYKAYHTLFYLDYYLSMEPEKFSPPSSFTLSEFDPSGALPEKLFDHRNIALQYEACAASRNTIKFIIASGNEQSATMGLANKDGFVMRIIRNSKIKALLFKACDCRVNFESSNR